LIVAALIGQILYGVVLDRSWRPWYRRKDNPVGFWTIIAIQTVMLLAIAIGLILVMASERWR
jgi:hypothetical protein